ncbi:DUF4436 domain-containing protein [Mycobacterium bourgelatii]|uniref:DUF4436 domain-containing protein n=2 Tax=Mycobacterium bourgelatii TaxID=1273442 RepID=A0A7I9YIU7_MYCBU|nr:DUF4436 domain-containing protein [Mycobacterium bourgelatii]
MVLGFLTVYALSLFGFHVLAKAGDPLPPPDLGTTEDTVVVVRLEEMKPTPNPRLSVKVLVIPEDDMYDSRLQVLKTDTAVRFYPENDLGDLLYPAGKSPAQMPTTLEAHGNPATWPFDSYRTDPISADVLVGEGDARKYIPARVEVTGKLENWDATITRVHDPSDTENPDSRDDVIITLHRSKAPLIFDLGLLLVLFAMPTLALAVAIQIALGKRKFAPPFVTWFAAMLFAVIPIRTFLPGAPQPGAWVDQALVLWVLLGLVGAMGLYMFSWYRQSD